MTPNTMIFVMSISVCVVLMSRCRDSRMSSESDSRTEEVDSDIKSTMFYASREENVQSSSSTLHIS